MSLFIDPQKYPTLVKYIPEVIEKAVKQLQEKYPDMSVEQCLLNLDMDLEQIDIQS